MKDTVTGRILVIEDEMHIAEGLRLNLSLQGYEVEIARDGSMGLVKWKEWQPDLIVLDIMLPVIDGFSVLRSIRLEDERIPILILSAKESSKDKVRGLSSGVDDYMTKPFNLDEFLLRVERLMVRTTWDKKKDSLEFEGKALPDFFIFGNNRIDLSTGEAICKKGEIRLTGQEIKLLKLFIANIGKPMPRKKLLEIGWGISAGTETRTVDNFIVRFRKYFEDDPRKPKFFKSLRSIGYVFVSSTDS